MQVGTRGWVVPFFEGIGNSLLKTIVFQLHWRTSNHRACCIKSWPLTAQLYCFRAFWSLFKFTMQHVPNNTQIVFRENSNQISFNYYSVVRNYFRSFWKRGFNLSTISCWQILAKTDETQVLHRAFLKVIKLKVILLHTSNLSFEHTVWCVSGSHECTHTVSQADFVVTISCYMQRKSL